MRYTANGSPAYRTTKSACLDLFAMIGAARRHPAQAVQLFEKAYNQEPALALRVLLWARDVRGGAGERQVFRNILHWLERRAPHVVVQLIESGVIPEVGRWDDMLHLRRPQSTSALAAQVEAALARGDRLAAKWMPRQGPVAAALAAALGLTQAQWRRRLVALSDTVEQRLCSKTGPVTYAHVPSVAMARYQQCFMARDRSAFSAYLQAVTDGRERMHAHAVLPHDILKAARLNDEAATVQWAALPRPALADDVLVMCDVSGSMHVHLSGNTTALDVAVSLSLLLAESVRGVFARKVLTFSASPQWHTIQEGSLMARYNALCGADWGMNTNLEAAYDQILALAIRHANEPDFKLPSTLLVLSDMEFDAAVSSTGGRRRNMRTLLERARDKFSKAGFELPRIVFWNLNARKGTLPAADLSDTGVALVSGYSARIAGTVLAGEAASLTPEALMREAVSASRYDVPGLTC